ncbi:MAG: HVO_0416 family zinc finger protein [Halorhabdus sp.]
MATAPSTDEVIDEFLSRRGHETETTGWEESYNKKQCPDCGALHDPTAADCSVCGWAPPRPS